MALLVYYVQCTVVVDLLKGGGQGEVEVGRWLTFTSEREVNERTFLGGVMSGLQRIIC